MLIGKEQPDNDDKSCIKIGDTVKIVSVGQERMDELDSSKSVYEEISENLDEIELGTQSVLSRAYLSWFGFKGQTQQAKVRHLVTRTVLRSSSNYTERFLSPAQIHPSHVHEKIHIINYYLFSILFFPLIFFHLKCKVGNLSGGERNRVQLAKLLKAGGNMIILDEPSVSIIQRGNMNLNFLKRLKNNKKTYSLYHISVSLRILFTKIVERPRRRSFT